MPDDAPPWLETIVATWPVPDPQPILPGSAVAGVLGWTMRVLLRRKQAANFELVLSPDGLRLIL